MKLGHRQRGLPSRRRRRGGPPARTTSRPCGRFAWARGGVRWNV